MYKLHTGNENDGDNNAQHFLDSAYNVSKCFVSPFLILCCLLYLLRVRACGASISSGVSRIIPIWSVSPTVSVENGPQIPRGAWMWSLVSVHCMSCYLFFHIAFVFKVLHLFIMFCLSYHILYLKYYLLLFSLIFFSLSSFIAPLYVK